MCIATFSLVLYIALFSYTLDRTRNPVSPYACMRGIPLHTSRIRRMPGVAAHPALINTHMFCRYPRVPTRDLRRAIRREARNGPLCWRRVRRWSGRAYPAGGTEQSTLHRPQRISHRWRCCALTSGRTRSSWRACAARRSRYVCAMRGAQRRARAFEPDARMACTG